ncbi:SH3 domain containing protein 5 [Sarcoptes scabiei]|uniref:SH3 domain containing protein 5 n=1 Tax=Sarcoptes scabiei TaxID=52283 RepID=A0A132ABR0_SARSC|nr:SH3 domain containing protein 5 [Sarcoptes scabiei]
MHEEIISSVNEIDKTRKLYFEEEHLAKQARDKEEKIKKRKTGIFASFTSLQNKKERTSAHREASDIQSTQARNDYLMALAAGNAHLEHYFNQDLVNLMLTIDDNVLDKCRSFMINLLHLEKDVANNWWTVIEKTINLLDKTSTDHTNSIFLRDSNSSCLTDCLLYEFQPCDNDSIDHISLEHNADIALRNEGQKWFTWFSKECRNLNRLSAQLIRLQALSTQGQKTVDLPGVGQVDIENRIDEIRQQLRKCEISKTKAKARLQIIKESGAEIDDFIGFEAQVSQEIKQQSLDVDAMNLPLSRTSSMRSHAEVESRISKNETENSYQNEIRPESSSSIEQLDSPDREALQPNASGENTTPVPTSSSIGLFSHSGLQPQSWSYDPTQAWEDEPIATSTNTETGIDNAYQDQEMKAFSDDSYQQDTMQHQPQLSGHIDHSMEEMLPPMPTPDGFTLIGKQCMALYSYQAQNDDELSFQEQDILHVINADDRDWVQARNDRDQIGYVPASYLQEIDENYDDHNLQQSIEPQFTISVEEQFTQSSSSTAAIINQEINVDDQSWSINETVVSMNTTVIVDLPNQESLDHSSFPLPPPPLPPPPLSSSSQYPAETSSISSTGEEVDKAGINTFNLGPKETPEQSILSSKPPPLPPPQKPPIDLEQNEEENLKTEQIKTSIMPQPPSFAPPPKPMQLMAPQAVVIIQPTPEIESRPSIGSGNDFEEKGNELAKNQHNECNSNSNDEDHNERDNHLDNDYEDDENEDDEGEDVSDKFYSNNGMFQGSKLAKQNEMMCSRMTTAANEISEMIARQAIDDSLKELERRRSSASVSSQSQDCSQSLVIGNEDGDSNVNDRNLSSSQAPMAQTSTLTHNGDLSLSSSSYNHDDENYDEDMK